MFNDTDEKKIEQAKERARKYNREGWGSRAAVLHAIYDMFETGIPEDMFIRICTVMDPFHVVASGFYENGRGYGCTMCGALAGGLAAFSMVHGWKEFPYKFWTEGMKSDGWISTMLEDPGVTLKDKAIAFIDHAKPLGYGGYYQIVSRFKVQFGTTDCLDLVRPYGDYMTREGFKNCHKIIIWTAGMVAQVILEYERDPESLEIDERHPTLYILGKNQTS
jgi:hypothetical protein